MIKDDIMNYFPLVPGKITAPREQQVYALNEIERLISEGKKRIILRAPVGTGKSGIATTILNKYGGIYTSPLNVLVDQLDKDFSPRYIATIKGRENYRCNAVKDRYVSCADGNCQIKLCSVLTNTVTLDGTIAQEYKKRHCDECFNAGCPCITCEYKKQMRIFKESKVGNTNFTMFQLGILNETEESGAGKVIVIDECDDIESFIQSFCSITIDEYLIAHSFEDHLIDLEDTEIQLDKLVQTLTELLEEIEDIEQSKEISSLLKKETRRRDALVRLREDWECNGKRWSISHKDKRSTTYTPIVIDRFLEKLIGDKIIILMSATPKIFGGFEIIDVGSPFDPAIRQWQFVPMGSMSFKNRNYTIPNVAQFIGSLEGKILVHCNSYAVAKAIGDELRMAGIDPIVQVNYNSINPMEKGRKEVVSAFKEDDNPNSILLSVNLARGVDFPEEDITNNVIAVLPWPNPTDPLVRDKNVVLGTGWQAEDMANTIMQAYGRVNRNDRKNTITYIVDSNFNNESGRGVAKLWFEKNRHVFGEWFLEAEKKGEDGYVVCPVCKESVNPGNIYIVKYDGIISKICHECNVKKSLGLDKAPQHKNMFF
jgi:Rad3-related DNA helicase